jgi:hypothetical protein
MRFSRALRRSLLPTAVVVVALAAACTVLLPTEELLTFCVRPEECPSGLSCSGGVCLPDGPMADAGVDEENSDLSDDAGPAQ